MSVFMRLQRLIVKKMKMKKKNRSHIYNINRPGSRHGHKYSKYKKLAHYDDMVIWIKQYRSNIWSSTHEKAKQHLGWIEKKCCL